MCREDLCYAHSASYESVGPCGLRLLRPLIVWDTLRPSPYSCLLCHFRRNHVFTPLFSLLLYLSHLSAADTYERRTFRCFGNLRVLHAHMTHALANAHLYVLILALSILSPGLPARYLIPRESVLYFYFVASLNTCRDCILLKGKQKVCIWSNIVI